MTHSELDRRDLRIAPVMTGGTSLSVWMGGATVELYSMLREGGIDDPASEGSMYRRLCALTNTRPVIDVITGTSAGGLNGTLLAAGVVYRVDQVTFAELRKTWMDVADITELMRDRVSETTPESLLDGKEKFLEPVRRLVSQWQKNAPQETRDTPDDVDLVVTYTSVEPRDHTNIDHFGEEMSEIRFAGTLRFTTKDFLDRTEGQDAGTKLAHAAKASASLPGVFEPSNLSWWNEHADPQEPPNFYDNLTNLHDNLTNTTKFGSLFVVDGGVVVNMPLTEALERIYSRPSDTLVRRVVLYVSPTPRLSMRSHAVNRHKACGEGATTSPGKRSCDQASSTGTVSAPPLRKTLSTIVTAPRAEGISTDLQDIERHNRDVRQQRSTRSTLGWLLSDGNDPLAPGVTTRAESELMSLYREARAEDSIESLLERLRPVIGTRNPIDWKLVRTSLIRARRSQLPDALPIGPIAESEWRWGVATVEESVSTLASIVNRVMGVPIADQDGGPSTRDRAGIQERLKGHRITLQQVLDECREIRGYDYEFWTVQLTSLAQRLREEPVDDLEQFASTGFSQWPALTAAERPGRPAVARQEVLDRLRSGFLTVANIVQDVHVDLTTILTPASKGDGEQSSPGLRDETRREAIGLVRELAAIRSDERDLELICWGLLRLHVMQTVMSGRVQLREQRVEILQLSWNTPDYLTGRGPEEKLVGTEVARLGAFLKPSWRANDYFWGRMDAAPRLLQLLADPRRLIQLGISADELCSRLKVVPDERLTEELAFLNSTDRSVPHQLPRLVEILSRRRQLEIALEELPHIASTIGKPKTPRGLKNAIPEQAKRFEAAAEALEGQPSDIDIERVLCSMRVGEESLVTEAGSPLLRWVVTNASAVAIDALLAPSSGFRLPRGIRRLLKIGRRPIVGLVGRGLVRKFSKGGLPATYRCRVEANPT